MSFEINWENLISDEEICCDIKNFLNTQFNSVELPSFITELSVTDFSLGTIPPTIAIRHVGDPFDDFYHDPNPDDEEIHDAGFSNSAYCVAEDSESENEDDQNILNEALEKDIEFESNNKIQGNWAASKSSELIKTFHNHTMNNLGLGPHERDSPASYFSQRMNTMRSGSNRSAEIKKNENDIQFVLELDYQGDVVIEVTVRLLVNYPSTNFISLPIKLKMTGLEIHCLCAVAYLQEQLYFSVLCDLDDPASEYFPPLNSQSVRQRSNGSSTFMHGGNFVDYATRLNKERIDVIKNVKIDTEIGEVENNVLRNVGKVERFLVEQLRHIIRDEICWPSWICLDLSHA